jgi:hypothetical protein
VGHTMRMLPCVYVPAVVCGVQCWSCLLKYTTVPAFCASLLLGVPLPAHASNMLNMGHIHCPCCTAGCAHTVCAQPGSTVVLCNLLGSYRPLPPHLTSPLHPAPLFLAYFYPSFTAGCQLAAAQGRCCDAVIANSTGRVVQGHSPDITAAAAAVQSNVCLALLVALAKPTGDRSHTREYDLASLP